jgi:hypothetical protein
MENPLPKFICKLIWYKLTFNGIKKVGSMQQAVGEKTENNCQLPTNS